MTYAQILFAASHICSVCRKASKFKCFCCPTAVCGRCIYAAEFAVVKGNKGLCCDCTKLALLIEENANVDSDGVRLFSIMCYMQQEKEK